MGAGAVVAAGAGGLGILWLLAAASGAEAKRKVLTADADGGPKIMDGPLVSVIIPSYQEADFIEALLVSVQHQTYGATEVILADSSTDTTPSLAMSYGATVVPVPYGNLSLARNTGAAVAKGQMLFFVDADCILASDALEKLITALSQHGAVLAWGASVPYENGWHPAWWAISRQLQRFVPHLTTGRGVLILRGAFQSIGGYDPEVNPLQGQREDHDFGQRVAAYFGGEAVIYVPAALIGMSLRREKVFGYHMWKVPGVRNGIL